MQRLATQRPPRGRAAALTVSVRIVDRSAITAAVRCMQRTTCTHNVRAVGNGTTATDSDALLFEH